MSDTIRNYTIDLSTCILPDCGGELVELMYDETLNWITAVYRCSRCGREFTVKIEL